MHDVQNGIVCSWINLFDAEFLLKFKFVEHLNNTRYAICKRIDADGNKSESAKKAKQNFIFAQNIYVCRTKDAE